jgi:hypothetical protein
MSITKLFAGIAVAVLATSAQADWVETFDSHVAGTSITSANGWVEGSTLWETLGGAAPASAGTATVDAGGTGGVGGSNQAFANNPENYYTGARSIGSNTAGTITVSGMFLVGNGRRGGLAVGGPNFLNLGAGQTLWVDELHFASPAVTPVLLVTSISPNGVPAAGNSSNAVADGWNDFRIEVNFGGDSILYFAPIDAGTGLPTAAYTEISRVATPVGFDASYVGIMVTNQGGGVGGAAGWDNVTYTGVPIPEPATLGLVGLGALAMLRRKH